MTTLHEHDGDVGDAQPALETFPCHLDLKRVPVRNELRQRELNQRLSAPAPIACCPILDRKAGDQSNVAIGESAEQPASEGQVAEGRMDVIHEDADLLIISNPSIEKHSLGI